MVINNFKNQPTCISVHRIEETDTSTQIYGWKVVGHTYDEQIRLRDMATVVAAWPETAEDNVPTVPCLSADGHLLVLSARASRVRYGESATFIMIYPNDVTRVLPKKNSAQPFSSHLFSLWCIFDDGSVTSAYSYDSKYGSERVSLLDCPLSPFASDQLWRYNRTLRVYLASTTDKDRNAPILKAFITVPLPSFFSLNSSQELLTLCTSPLHNGAEYLTQWIEFHRLVGFRKFVVYNTTDTHERLSSVVNTINRKYSNLVDVVQWNFSSLYLIDILPTRYFQTEALHDCLIQYGDQSEWLGMLDLDEYIVPLDPYQTVLDYLHNNFRRRIIGSINLWSQFFCTKEANQYTLEENNKSRLIIDRFILRAPDLYKKGREKYLYRPRFVQYLSIHHQIIGLAKQQTSRNHILLAHYASMSRLRSMPGCSSGQYVTDTSVRDRFAKKVKDAIENLMA
ncbi:unnamed protein product [Rotaria magnacalcarata]|uniref:Glycosyltransferase family 92 protein n=2 Tax=Rotaria magnacalcarata TaxID=392030 RepID=A0A816ALB4_9BILA|nr:unnamed protein product [Rotaria magnacalcarata]